MMIVYLTCASVEEAAIIGKALLNARLVACVRQMPVSSSFWWEGKMDQANEVLLMMESVEAKFSAIEKVVFGLHSYDQPVLVAVPVINAAKGVETWLDGAISEQTGQ